MNLYDHDEDDPFAGFDQEGPGQVAVHLPIGETLLVSGPRQMPVIISISNKTERNPKRDARMLATFLSTSLDEQTIYFLSEYLFAEHLAPMMQDRLLKPVATPPEVKKSRKPKEDEHQDK